VTAVDDDLMSGAAKGAEERSPVMVGAVTDHWNQPAGEELYTYYSLEN